MKTSPLSAYRCYYCPFHGCFERVINHSVDIHTDKPLKCRQLIHRQANLNTNQNSLMYCHLNYSHQEST